MKKETGLRSLYALIGVAILGFGAALLRVGGVGLDPYTAANIGVGELLGLSIDDQYRCPSIDFYLWPSPYRYRYGHQYGADRILHRLLYQCF